MPRAEQGAWHTLVAIVLIIIIDDEDEDDDHNHDDGPCSQEVLGSLNLSPTHGLLRPFQLMLLIVRVNSGPGVRQPGKPWFKAHLKSASPDSLSTQSA